MTRHVFRHMLAHLLPCLRGCRYDNEYGYSCRLVDVAAHVAKGQQAAA